MKREELLALGLTDEQVDKVMEQNGKDINNAKKNNVDPKELKRLQDIDAEYQKLQDANLTDAEKIKKALEDAESVKKEFATKTNRLEVEKILVKAGLAEEDYKDLIEGIVTDDAERSTSLANGLATMLQGQIAKAKQKAEEDLLDKTPTPNPGGDQNDTKRDSERIAESLAKAASGNGNDTKTVIGNYL